MKKIHILGLTLFALLAFGAIAASSAMAEVPPILCVNDSQNVTPKYATEAACEAMTPEEPAGEWALGWEWLVEGKALAAPVASETEGELTLVQFASAGSLTVLVEIKCLGIFDGTIGPGRLDTVEDLLDLEHVLVEELADNSAAHPLSCEVTHDEGASTDCKEGTLASVWVEHLSLSLELSWDTEIIVGPNGEPRDLFTALEKGGASVAEPGYEAECESLFLGVRGTEQCEGGVIDAFLENSLTTTPVSVSGEFKKLTATSERGSCKGVKEDAENVGSGHTWAIGAELERLETAIS